jgi:hypothetical protein
MSKVTSHNVMEVTKVLRQAHLGAALHVVGSVPQCYVVSLPDFICNVISQCVVYLFLRNTRP